MRRVRVVAWVRQDLRTTQLGLHLRLQADNQDNKNIDMALKVVFLLIGVRELLSPMCYITVDQL
jgi:hypothetical protein